MPYSSPNKAILGDTHLPDRQCLNAVAIALCEACCNAVSPSCDLTCRHYQGLLDEYSTPKEGTKELHFDDKYPKSLPVQFSAIFTKYMAVYWRMPEYNGTRFFLALAVGFIFGAIFWRLGDRL